MKKRKVMKILLVITSILLLKFVLSFVINALVIRDYENGGTSEIGVNLLYPFNFSESYIAPYNHGNILYQKGEYEDAKKKYKEALKQYPPKSRVCLIRVNLSVAMLATMDASDKDAANKIIEEALNNLYQDNCAHEEDDNGDSKDAEQLEQIIKEVQKIVNGQSDSNQGGNGGSSNEQSDPNEQQNIENQLQQYRQDANGSRQDDMNFYENYGNYEYYDGKTW